MFFRDATVLAGALPRSLEELRSLVAELAAQSGGHAQPLRDETLEYVSPTGAPMATQLFRLGRAAGDACTPHAEARLCASVEGCTVQEVGGGQ